MRLTIASGAERHDVEVEVVEPAATVGALREAVIGGAQAGLWSADVWLAPDRPLASVALVDGTVLATEPRAPSAPMPCAPWELVAVGGLDVGRRWPLAVGRWVLGGASDDVDLAHPSVAPAHATLTIGLDGDLAVEDLGTAAGTWLDGSPVTGRVAMGPGGVLRLGLVEVTVRRVTVPAAPRPMPPPGRTTVSCNRPPRPGPPPPPTSIPLPRPVAPDPARTSFGLVSVVAPVVLGGAMAVLLGDWRYGLLALLGPVTAIAQGIDTRRRARRHRRVTARAQADDLRRFADALAAAVVSERQRGRVTLVDPVEAMRRATTGDVRLWERRPGALDVGLVRVGTATVGWSPPIDGRVEGRDLDPEVGGLLDAHRQLAGAPLQVDVVQEVVGIAGPRPAALAVARSLVLQAAVHHGPADLAVLVADGRGRADDWRWSGWLPHPERGPTILTVLDEDTDPARPSAVRLGLAADGVGGVVLAARARDLPAACATVVELDGDGGRAWVRRSGVGDVAADVVLAGVGGERAEAAARSLAAFHDPEASAAAGLPATASLRRLLGLAADGAAGAGATALAGVGRRWADHDRSTLATPIGIAADGPFTLDLIAHGPHALVAGTTGSGKSELLRSLVVGLAASAPPTEVTFLLLDFKGGAAFAACAHLPHTVGLVTDLDPSLAERVLRSLRAELRHREQRLQTAEVDDLLRFHPPDEDPLPRLVVVVDEFATLAGDLPGFVGSLVDLARRGRSLGIHLVLATQRPAGAVSDQIRGNTDLRIALRVQDPADALDVVGTPEAAALDRDRPGRALVRFGHGPPRPVQVATASGRADGDDRAPVRVRPLPRRSATPAPSAPARPGGGLAALVATCVEAHAASGRPPPRRPWLDPLPERLAFGDLDREGAATVGAFALADDPDHQRQQALAWCPAAGNLVVVGAGGSGTTTTLLAVAHALAAHGGARPTHLYGLDLGAGGLHGLAGWAQTGAVVRAAEGERQERLVRFLADELDRRRALDRGALAAQPRIVLLLDGLGPFRSAWDDGLDGVWSGLARVFADGTAVGLHVAVTAARPAAVPAAMAGVAGLRLVHRLADPADATAFGLAPAAVLQLLPGRAVVAGTGQLVQVAVPPAGGPTPSCPAVAGMRPVGIGTLPSRVDGAALGAASFAPGRWWLPVGIGDRALAPVGLALEPGTHALVAGPGRGVGAGVLATIAARALAATDRPTVLVVASFRGALTRSPAADLVVTPGELVQALGALLARGPVLALVDDADRVGDPDDQLAALLDDPSGDLRVVAAGRSDGLRTRYGHWTASVRRSRTGLLVQPDVDLDGDLLGIRLPRRAPGPLTAGRGYLVADGAIELVQAAVTERPAP